MNPNSSCKNLKVRPKPVLNRKINRFKTQGTNEEGVNGNIEFDKTESCLTNIPLVSEKSDLIAGNFQRGQLTSSSGTGTNYLITTSANTRDDNKSNNPEPIRQIDISNCFSLVNDNIELDSSEAKPGVSNNPSPLSILKRQFVSIDDKPKPMSKATLIRKTIAIYNKHRRAKQFITVPVSEQTNHDRGIKSNAGGKSTGFQGELCLEILNLKEKSDNSPPINSTGCSNYQEGVMAASQENGQILKNILTNSSLFSHENTVFSDGKLKEKQIINTTLFNDVNNNKNNDSNLKLPEIYGGTSTQFVNEKNAVSEFSLNFVSPEETEDCDAGSFSQKKRPNLKELRSNAYDENGNLNTKRMCLRDFIYFNPPHNPMTKDSEDGRKESEENSCSLEEHETTQVLPASPVSASLQVMVGADGKIIIDPKSVALKPRVNEKSVGLKKCNTLNENDFSNNFNKRKPHKQKESMKSLLGIEKQKQPRQRWSVEETLKFYEVLDKFGSDFSLMANDFPNRTRKQLKNKFLLEDKNRRKYVDLAMSAGSNLIDFDELKQELKKKQRKKSEEDIRIIEEKKESRRRVELEYAKFKKGKKTPTILDMAPGIRRVGKGYDEKVKRMKKYVKRLNLKYLEETGENENNNFSHNLSNSNCKEDDYDSDSNEGYLFLEMLFQNTSASVVQNEEKYIQEIKSENDLCLFLELVSEMYCELGKNWCDWAKRKVIDQLLMVDGDSEAKQAATEMKTCMEEEEDAAKLERSYQLYFDAYDYFDPFAKGANN